MISPAAFLTRVVDPGLDWTATHGGVHQSRAAARQFLLAVAIQETSLEYRAQQVAGEPAQAGPARGWWQFEAPTIGLLMRHGLTTQRLAALCRAAAVRFEQDDIWRAIEGHDLLACAVARLLVFTDPYAIPTTEDEGWACYSKRLWRPGKPHPERWFASWQAAQTAQQM